MRFVSPPTTLVVGLFDMAIYFLAASAALFASAKREKDSQQGRKDELEGGYQCDDDDRRDGDFVS